MDYNHALTDIHKYLTPVSLRYLRSILSTPAPQLLECDTIGKQLQPSTSQTAPSLNGSSQGYQTITTANTITPP